MNDLAGQLKQFGVVGAGGAGFPTYVKAGSQVEYVLANGAECEPLIHKDFELMVHFPEQIVAGMRLMIEATGAKSGIFGVKEKNQEAIHALEPSVSQAGIDFCKLGDFYPSGDEYELVYAATGRLIPPAGLPLQVGCVVNNVETLYNVARASQGLPVTHKLVSVAGAVNQPKSFWVPVGTSFRDLIQLAGGATAGDCGVFVSGLMMGWLTFDVEDVVTKTTAGLILLPKDHYLVERKSRTNDAKRQIGKSACDQCSYCTEFCPRYLLGYEVMPHRVMRSLGFSQSGAGYWNQWADLCCACGLCTLYACPEDLYPKEACDDSRKAMRALGIRFEQQKPVEVHPMKEYRRVPQSQLRKRLRVEEYHRETPFENIDFVPSRVRIKLSQHVGKAAVPAVKAGKRVKQGEVVGRVGDADLGAFVHSSVNGIVRGVTDAWVEIETKEK